MKRVHAASLRWGRPAPLILLPLLYLTVVYYQLSHLQISPPPHASALSFKIVFTEHSSRQNASLHLQRVRKAEDADLLSRPQTPAPASPSSIKGRRTMVLLVNFLDSKRCAETLQSMFANAVQPELLRVSIHDQIFEAKGDLPCVDVYCQLVDNGACRRGQIVSTKVDAKDATGPTVARAIVENAIRDEDFCLGIDSHLVFIPKWDEQVVANWEATANPNAILTVYPKSTEYLTDPTKDHKMGVQCTACIETADGDAMVMYQAVRWVDKTAMTTPRLQSQFAGGFNFGSCQAYRDVPNDPYTPILFYGEEYARAARLWTFGYDFYAPSVDVVYHWFEDRKKIWDLDWAAKYPIMQRSKRRVRLQLGLSMTSDDVDRTELHKYRLGTKRTLDQWKQFSGIDPAAKYDNKNRTQFVNCDELRLVPFITDDQSRGPQE